MINNEEKDSLLQNNKHEERNLCLALVCVVTAIVIIIVGIVVSVVISPIGIVAIQRSHIHLQYIYQGVEPSNEAKNVVFSAFQKWSEYIYALDLPYRLSSGTYCDDYVTIDDSMNYAGIFVVVEFAQIDGEGNVLAFAGPCTMDANGIPRLGLIVVDATDVDILMAYGEFLLEDVIMHEIGHVLGLGTLWIPNVTYSVPAPGPNNGYLYRLKHANDAHFFYGGTGVGALVEDTGGPGTTASHWKENVYGNELMTGFLNVGNGGGIMSRITLGGLQDIGYSINYDHPDLYSLPTRRRLRGSNMRIYHVNDSINFIHP